MSNNPEIKPVKKNSTVEQQPVEEQSELTKILEKIRKHPNLLVVDEKNHYQGNYFYTNLYVGVINPLSEKDLSPVMEELLGLPYQIPFTNIENNGISCNIECTINRQDVYRFKTTPNEETENGVHSIRLMLFPNIESAQDEIKNSIELASSDKNDPENQSLKKESMLNKVEEELRKLGIEIVAEKHEQGTTLQRPIITKLFTTPINYSGLDQNNLAQLELVAEKLVKNLNLDTNSRPTSIKNGSKIEIIEDLGTILSGSKLSVRNESSIKELEQKTQLNIRDRFKIEKTECRHVIWLMLYPSTELAKEASESKSSGVIF